MHAMMQTRMQKVEKFFVFFSTKLGLLQKPREARNLGKPRGLVLSGIPGGALRRLLVERSFVETRQAWRASTGMESLYRLRAWSLAKIRLKSLVGPGRPARGTLVSTVPTHLLPDQIRLR